MTGRIAAMMRGRRTAGRTKDHALREQRLENIRDAVEQFTYSLGLLIAGHGNPEGAVAGPLAARLGLEVRPFLDAGEAMRPDFGAFGDLRIEGDLLQSSEPVLATLEFDDRCTRETAQGRTIVARGRRLRIAMRVSVDPALILDCSVADISARRD